MQRISVWLAAVLVTVLCALLLAGYHVPTFEGTDENGYLLTGKRLATSGDIAKRTTDPFEFVSGNWVETQPGVFYAKYPIGYPLLVAVAYRFGGPDAVFWVNPVLAVLTVWGVFLLGRAVWNSLVGLLAAILVTVNPLLAHFGLSALSHTGAACSAVWAMYATWRWWQGGGWPWAVAGGMLVGAAISVRYTEGLLLLPVVVAMVNRLGDMGWRPVRRDLVWWAAGLTLALTPLIWQHIIAYGAPWRTGYGLCGEATGFGWRWLRENWWLMLQRMNGTGLPLLFPLGVAGLLWLTAHQPSRGLWLGAWIVPPLLVYSAYYWAPQGEGPGYVRFFVSVFPALTLTALGALSTMLAAHRTRALVLGVFVLMTATWSLRETTRALDKRLERALLSRATATHVAATVPEGAVIFAADHLLNYIEFWGTYRLYGHEMFDRQAIANRLKVLQTDDPHPFHRAKAQRIANLLGSRTDAQLARLQLDRLRRHAAAERPVYLLAHGDGLRRWRLRVGEWFEFPPVAQWSEWQTTPKNEVRIQSWTLHAVMPRPAAVDEQTIAGLQRRIEQLQAQAQLLRTQYRERYPGAEQEWARITQLEREIRDLQEELKKLRRRLAAAGSAGGAS